MINIKVITQAVENLLKDNLHGYIITRNEERNVDPSIAIQQKGWIGIYRGPVEYESYVMGAIPWRALIDIIVEVQVADMQSGSEAEFRI